MSNSKISGGTAEKRRLVAVIRNIQAPGIFARIGGLARCAIVANMSRPFDTTADAAALHEQAYREMGLAGRLRIALELSDLTHSFAVAGIRRRHPGCSDQEARIKLAEFLYGSSPSVRE